MLKGKVNLQKEDVKINYELIDELFKIVSDLNKKFRKKEYKEEGRNLIHLTETNHLTGGSIYLPEDLNEKLKLKGYTMYDQNNKSYSNFSMSGSIYQLKKDGDKDYIIQYINLSYMITTIKTKNMEITVEGKEEVVDDYLNPKYVEEYKLKKLTEMTNNILKGSLENKLKNLKERKTDIDKSYERLLKLNSKNNEILNKINKDYNEISLC